MKEIAVSLWEVDISEIEKLPINTPVLQYRPDFGSYSIRYAGISVFSTKYKYFLFNNPEETHA